MEKDDVPAPGKDYDYDAPVKLLDRMMHDQVKEEGQNVVVVGQVLAADINIGGVMLVALVRPHGLMQQVQEARGFSEVEELKE